MLGLRSCAPAFSLLEGERIALEHYGLALTASSLDGERDCNLRLSAADGRQFVLKILDEDADQGAAARLVAVLSHLGQVGAELPIPHIIPTEQGNQRVRIQRDAASYEALLIDFLPGQHLQGPQDPATLRHIGSTLARIDRALQGFFHTSLERSLAWDLRALPRLMQWADYIEPAAARRAVAEAALALEANLPALLPLRSQAIHADCHPGNLLIEPGAGRICGILDFGDMLHGPVIFEPAIAMAEILMEGLSSLDDVGAVLQGFTQNQRLDAAEVELLPNLVAARHAITLLVHAWRARHHDVAAQTLSSSASRASDSLQALQQGGQSLRARWHAAAGTLPRQSGAVPVSLPRRHRLLGAGAELFYEKPVQIERGEDVWLFDVRGRRYLDVYNNVPHVGHGHPAVVAAIARQSALLATHTRYLHAGILDYAEELMKELPPHLDTCLFVNSGSEANDVAWRIAKMASGHQGALIMEYAYHGITDAVGALTPGSDAPAAPWVAALSSPWEGAPSAQQLSQAQLDAQRAIGLLDARGFAPAAWFIDSALTSSGIIDAPREWARLIEQTVRSAGGLVVADEVQFGLGRCGSHFWSFERRGLTPDIVTLGKPLGNGYPLGILIANRQLIEPFQSRFGFFSTFGGNAVAAAAGQAVLHVLREEHLVANALTTGAYLRERLAAVVARHASLHEVRGCGLLQGVRVGGGDAPAARANTRRIVNVMAAEHGVLIGAEGPGGNVLKLRPPMTFRKPHADLLVAALDAAAAGVH